MTTNFSHTTDTTSGDGSFTVDLIIGVTSGVSAFLILILISLAGILHYRRQSKSSVKGPASKTTRQKSAEVSCEKSCQEPEIAAVKSHITVEMPEIVSDYQDPKDLITAANRYSEINYASVEESQTDPTAHRTGPTAAGAVSKSDGTTVDPTYAKVKKQKKSRNHLYSKPIKTKKQQHFSTAADHKSSAHNGASLEDLYTKSKKQKRHKNKSESEAIDAMYTKPKKKRKKKTKNVSYANDLQLQKIRDDINTKNAATEDSSKHVHEPR